jgi:RimJ/RimL family protein N-acetyltransferase
VSSLEQALSALVTEHQRARGRKAPSVRAPASGDVEVRLEGPDGEPWQLRSVREEDVPRLVSFRDALGPASRALFCPYPWDDPAVLPQALARSIQSAREGTDASFVLLAGEAVRGHFFLWKAGGNPHSRAHGVDVPELGVAVADAFHGRGLGLLSVRVLQEVARELGRDAIELTTATTNDAGWHVYRKAGFEYVGDIRNPLEVDVTAAAAGQVVARRFRVERQMVHVIEEGRREAVLRYLALKRAAA